MKTDLIERLRAHADNYAATGLTHELCRDAAAALEAGASGIGCMCRGVEIGSHMASVSLPIPEHMADYRDARVAAGLSPMISVDACLVVELRLLWARGIRTYGSCCGHNKVRGMINVHEDDRAAMLAMGYEQWPEKDGMAVATFYPKSARGLASEGERRGLERAAEVAETWRRVDPASRRTIADHFAVSEDDMLVAVATADGIAEAIRALIPEPAMDGWQPISSAPKDGTNVIVAEPDGNVTIARWLDRDESWWELNNDSTDVWGFALNAVHWRPLPPPPSQDREPDSQRGAK